MTHRAIGIIRLRFPLLTALLGNWLLRLTRRKAGVALLYHGIDTRHGDPGSELSPPIERRAFARQLRHLRRFYQLVAPEELLTAVSARRRGQRFPVALTFDDDLRQHVDCAMPILREAGVPATFFLCGASLAAPKSAWWERLQRAVQRGQSPASLAELLPQSANVRGERAIDIQVLGQAVEALAPDQRRSFSERLLERAGPDPIDAGLPREGVAQLVSAGFGIGFHTRDHDTLTALDDAQLERAMEHGRKELSAATGKPLLAIAYPHGRADARVANAARRAGFEIGFTGAAIAATPTSDPLLLGRRDTVGLGHSLGEFALGVAGTLWRDSSGN